MGIILPRTLSLSFLLFVSGVLFAASSSESDKADWPAIRLELEAIFKTDQAMRKESNALVSDARSKDAEVDKAVFAGLWKKIAEQDRRNQQRVSEIADKYGWPKQSLVGSLAATSAFLVVQHADLEYQLKYLDSVREASLEGEASKTNFALLEDRVLLRQGKPQRYGSQVDTRSGVSIMWTDDEANLDARRASVDLAPICEYLERFVTRHGKVVYPPCVK